MSEADLTFYVARLPLRLKTTPYGVENRLLLAFFLQVGDCLRVA